MRKQDRMEAIAFSKQNKTAVIDTTVTDYMKLLNPNNYQKGGWILHMLRRELGDTIFWKSIRDYYALYAGRNADTHDLQKVFEKNSGKDLNTFFKQWLYTPGQPSLTITWKESAGKKLDITVNQLQPVPYIFPLEIGIISASGKTKIETLHITGQKQQSFSLTIDERVKNIMADPAVNLLFEEKTLRVN
jgi:aminopeptidase N